ncbi:MAG TPA: cupin domain-containing protein [Steroidobacteraceae bacterium]|nr:cupin domain-containing protein [Steroidobacteraceae bacterium]
MRARLLPALAAALISANVLGGMADQATDHSSGFVRLAPEQVRWQTVAEGFGAQIATIAGDPARAGLYVQRVRFPPHVMTRPHWHATDRYVTVLKGTWFAGEGPTFDPRHAQPMKPGSYMFHPARALHWDGSNSDEEVIVQVFGMGPLESVRAEPGKPAWARVP